MKKVKFFLETTLEREEEKKRKKIEHQLKKAWETYCGAFKVTELRYIDLLRQEEVRKLWNLKFDTIEKIAAEARLIGAEIARREAIERGYQDADTKLYYKLLFVIAQASGLLNEK